MVIYRYLKNQKLYLIYKVSPRGYLGNWYEAVPYKHNDNILKNIDLKYFSSVAES